MFWRAWVQIGAAVTNGWFWTWVTSHPLPSSPSPSLLGSVLTTQGLHIQGFSSECFLGNPLQRELQIAPRHVSFEECSVAWSCIAPRRCRGQWWGDCLLLPGLLFSAVCLAGNSVVSCIASSLTVRLGAKKGVPHVILSECIYNHSGTFRGFLCPLKSWEHLFLVLVSQFCPHL